MGEEMMVGKHILNKMLGKYRDKIIIVVQAVLGVILALRAIDKELEARFKLAQKIAKGDAKRKNNLKNALMKNSKKLAKAKFKVKAAKLKTKAKTAKVLGNLAVQKAKAKARKKKAKLKAKR